MWLILKSNYCQSLILPNQPDKMLLLVRSFQLNYLFSGFSEQWWHWNVEWDVPSMTRRTEHSVHFLFFCAHMSSPTSPLYMFSRAVFAFLSLCRLSYRNKMLPILELHKSRTTVFPELHNVKQKRWVVYNSRRVLQHVHIYITSTFLLSMHEILSLPILSCLCKFYH